MSSRLADRLNAAHRFFFVGRALEQSLFMSALSAERLPFYVLYVHGPGGVGKTTLLKQFIDICSQTGVSPIYLDARNIDPSPASFIAGVQSALGLTSPASPFDFLANQLTRFSLFIDTYENLAPLDEWVCKEFLPQLPENVVVVLAGRQPPSLAWRADPAWQAMIQVLALRNLEPEASRTYLQKRNVPEDQHQAMLEFTHGHPLALSLVADVFAQRENARFVPEETPDVVKTLLEQFVQKVPGPAHRTALEACSLVRVTTEALLCAMLENAEVHDLFEWLRGLSLIEFRRGGLFPHDLAREALVADLRWRNPDWYHELKRRARKYYSGHLEHTSSQEQQRILLDYIFLHRDNPVVRPFFEWQVSGSALTDTLRNSDLPALLAMVANHEGQESASLAALWLEQRPEDALVMRDAKGVPAGFITLVPMHYTQVSEDYDPDPALRAARVFLDRKAPLRSGERATFFRFWMAKDTYQDVSPIQSLIFIQMVRHYLSTPGLAYTFLPCANADFWAPVFTYADLHRIPEADFTINGHRYGVYGHDWRVLPPLAWLELMGERENAAAPETVSVPLRSEPLLVLSQQDFANAVREALRLFVYPTRLGSNPLLRSRLVVSETNLHFSENERILRLQDLIRQAGNNLLASPRTEKYGRALDLTYFHPLPTQESAAEALDLPFSTYRRHLKTGIELVTEILWQRELGTIEK
jgi:hypothetical protein